jgi:drug/metabolite transporter (DMT)-like permease
MTPRSTLLPSLAVAASGFTWGIWWLPLRNLEAAGLVGNWANVGVYALAALLTAPLAYAARRGKPQQLRQLLTIGLLSGLSLCLWNYALLTGNIVRVTLLFYLAPIWCTALSLIVFKEPVRAVRILTILGGLAGAAVLVGIEKGAAAPLSTADGMALLSSLLFAAFTVYIRKVGVSVGGWEKTFFTAWMGAGLAFIAVMLVPEGPVPRVDTVISALPALLLCMVWQVVLLAMFLWGSAYLESGRVAIYLLLEVVAAVVSASLLTDEPFGWREAIGCLLIVGAGLLEGMQEMRRSRALGRQAREFAASSRPSGIGSG